MYLCDTRHVLPVGGQPGRKHQGQINNVQKKAGLLSGGVLDTRRGQQQADEEEDQDQSELHLGQHLPTEELREAEDTPEVFR